MPDWIMERGREKRRNEILKEMDRFGVPGGLQVGLCEYLMNGRPMGHFLTAVVSNDLKEAVARGDLPNVIALGDIVKFLYNEAPRDSWGSPQNFQTWSAKGGAEGIVPTEQEC